MKKQQIRFTIILMSAALMGLVAIQVYWVKNALELKEALFQDKVTDALHSITDRIEKKEAVFFITDYMDQASMIATSDPEGFCTVKFECQPRLECCPDSTEVRESFWVDSDTNVEFIHDKIDEKTEASVIVISTSDETVVYPNTDEETRSIEVHTRFSSTSDQEAPEIVVRAMSEEGTHELHREIISGSRETQEQVIMNNLLHDYLMASQSITTLLDSLPLERIIEEEFQRHTIHGNFHFALIKESTREVVEQNAIFTDSQMDEAYKVNLFPGNLFQSSNHYLAVFFPGQMSQILRSMWFMLLCSTLLILIIATGFANTILTMLKQKKLSEMKTDFINNMTHELKTPISTIALSTEALMDPTVATSGEQATRFVNVIQEENRRLQKHVDNVLQMAVMEKGELKMQMNEVNMNEVIENAVCNIRLQVDKKKGIINTDLNASNPVIVGDQSHIINVIYNLLDNANKYSPKNPDILISTRSNETGVLVSVTDKGIGMNKETQNKIFEKFFRVSTGNIHNVKGFGLGLSYVSHVLKEHNASITVESELNKGSNFKIFIPYNKHRLDG